MPSKTELYSPPEDGEIEVSHMPKAELCVIPSVRGHFAGGPILPREDFDFLGGNLKPLLAS